LKGRIHGIVLAGGRSLRMGTDKAYLKVNGKALIRHICDMLETVCGELTVVLPYGEPDRYNDVLNPSVSVVTDRFLGKGPLAGIHAGLSAMPDKADYAFIMACDMPVFSIGLYERMLSLVSGRPQGGDGSDFPEAVLCPGQPFHAFYHRSAALTAERLLEQDLRRLSALTDKLRCDYVLPEADDCFLNLNTREYYDAFEQSLKFKN
jgi:molybdopterin-guanine dinucleotide biosynthesis protein A